MSIPVEGAKAHLLRRCSRGESATSNPIQLPPYHSWAYSFLQKKKKSNSALLL